MSLQEKSAPPELVVYVDLDGVVQHEEVLWSYRRGIYMSPLKAPGRVLFEWVHYLVEALEPFPYVKLVLSSSWCRRPGYSNTLKRLPQALRERFIGGTYHRRIHGADHGTLTRFLDMPRGLQVVADVQRRRPKKWLALDDDDSGWPEWAIDNLIKCDGETGLSSPSVRDELQLKLERCHAALQCLRGGAP
jgi:hypothetical protein